MSEHTASAAGGALPAEGHKTRRALLRLFGAAALAILPAAALVSSAASPAPDPVYAAIAEHKRANAAFTAICTKYEDFGPEDMTDEQNAEYDAAMDADDDAMDDVARTVPTTRDGAVEALRYIFTDEPPHRIEAISAFIIMLMNVAFPADEASEDANV
jgi:hypothetical protein